MVQDLKFSWHAATSVLTSSSFCHGTSPKVHGFLETLRKADLLQDNPTITRNNMKVKTKRIEDSIVELLISTLNKYWLSILTFFTSFTSITKYSVLSSWIYYFSLSFIYSYNQFHIILRLFNVLPNFPFATSEMMRDYY